MELTARQRSTLRSLAHPLKPMLHVGKEGVTDSFLETLETAFNTRELLKLKVLDSAPEEARESAASIAGRLDDVHVVQVIGRTVVLYRRHPTDAKIKL
jgi:RNA-binding protein